MRGFLWFTFQTELLLLVVFNCLAVAVFVNSEKVCLHFEELFHIVFAKLEEVVQTLVSRLQKGFARLAIVHPMLVVDGSP